MKNKVKVTKFKGGGYIREEQIDNGVIGFEMNSKGWCERFAKPLIFPLKKIELNPLHRFPSINGRPYQTCSVCKRNYKKLIKEKKPKG